MAGKQPYIPLYTGDYLKDTRILPLEARGAWVDIMIFMWESKEKGTITGTMDEFALMLGCSLKKSNAIIGLLQEKGICDFEVMTGGHIKLISRRIVRDVELSEKRKQAGSKGGNPNLVKQNTTKTKTNGYPFSDNDNDNDNEVKINKEHQNVSRGSCVLDDCYDSGQQMFDEVKSDDQLVERLVRIVHQSGFISCPPVIVLKATRNFITREEAKPDFKLKPRDEHKKYLVNWITSKAKILNQYA